MVNPKKTRRVTIILDGEVDEKLRKIQGRGITYVRGSYSFSKVCNDVLREGLQARGVK
jgi:hypothetical protein